MNLEPRARREHSYCDAEIARLNDHLNTLEHRNASLVYENSTLRQRALQAERECAEAVRESRELLAQLIENAAKQAARTLPVVVA